MRSMFAAISEPGQLRSLAEEIRAWEPGLELDYEAGSGHLYSPDATLYALNLGETCTLSTDRRRQEVARGEIVVVPQGVGLRVDPGGDFLRLQDFGPAPALFRERFIQVSGFELLRGLRSTSSTERFRIDLEDLPLDAVSVTIPAEPWDARLLVHLDGWAEVILGDIPTRIERGGGVCLVAPRTTVRVEGVGRLASLRLTLNFMDRTRSKRESHAL